MPPGPLPPPPKDYYNSTGYPEGKTSSSDMFTQAFLGFTFCRGLRLGSSSASSISSSTCSWLFHLPGAVASFPTRVVSALGLAFRAGLSRPNTTRSHSFSHLRRHRLVNC